MEMLTPRTYLGYMEDNYPARARRRVWSLVTVASWKSLVIILLFFQNRLSKQSEDPVFIFVLLGVLTFISIVIYNVYIMIVFTVGD